MQIDYDKILWNRIDRKSDSECWLWTGCINDRGHGYIRIANKYLFVHRVAWEITRGQKLQSNMWIDRTCGNNRCCNPRHLQIKATRGSGHYKSKLTEDDVIEIYKLWMSGQAQHRIASQFDVSRSNIRHIINRRSWKHINLDRINV